VVHTSNVQLVNRGCTPLRQFGPNQGATAWGLRLFHLVNVVPIEQKVAFNTPNLFRIALENTGQTIKFLNLVTNAMCDGDHKISADWGHRVQTQLERT
jgi:hypothetical protein